MKRYFYFIVFISLIFGCNSPQGPLKFEEKTLSMNESVSLEINYPWYTEGSERADSINATVGNVIANSVNMQDSLKNTSIEAAANTFKNTFERFKKDFNVIL